MNLLIKPEVPRFIIYTQTGKTLPAFHCPYCLSLDIHVFNDLIPILFDILEPGQYVMNRQMT